MEQPAPRVIRLETPGYIVRTLEPSDAAADWGEWLTDPQTVHNLNARPMRLDEDERRAYIETFDRTTAHALGIFDKVSNRLVGIRAVYVDPTHKEFLVNVLIGDPLARNKGARTQSRAAVYRYFFEDLDLHTARSSVLSVNADVIAGMAKRGWILEHTSRKPSSTGAANFVEIKHYRLPRDVWQAKTAHGVA